MTTYTVRQPIAPDMPWNGIVISRHRSAAAAHAAIAREQRRLRAHPGYRNSWVDRYVWDESEGVVIPPEYSWDYPGE